MVGNYKKRSEMVGKDQKMVGNGLNLSKMVSNSQKWLKMVQGDMGWLGVVGND